MQDNGDAAFRGPETHHPFPPSPHFLAKCRLGTLWEACTSQEKGGEGEGVSRDLATRSDLVNKLLA